MLYKYIVDSFTCTMYLNLFQIRSANVVPPIVAFLAKHPIVDKYDLTSLQTVTCGAAPLGEDVTDALKRRLPTIKTIRQGNVNF